MSEWAKYYLNDTMLKTTCESPSILRLPVGSCINVRVNKGYKIGDKTYRAIPSYVPEDKIAVLRELCATLTGWELYVGTKPLTVEEWCRGWVDVYYPLSNNPVVKCVLPSMYKVELRLIDIAKAKVSLSLTTTIPVCPTCTLEHYETKESKEVFDVAMRYFIHFWLYGQTL